MWLIVYSNDHAPLTVRPIYSSSKLRTVQMMIFSLVGMIGLEKMLHNICMSAVAMSLRWANRGPWASCFSVLSYFQIILFLNFVICHQKMKKISPQYFVSRLTTYHISLKYSDTLASYRISPKILTIPFWYLVICISKQSGGWMANCVPDQMAHSVASDQGLHCLLWPLRPNIGGKCGTLNQYILRNIFSIACMINSNVCSLTFTTLWAYSADKKLVIFFLFFPENRIDISCKLSPVETICMKCQILFSEK